MRELLLIPWGRGMGHLTRCLAVATAAVPGCTATVVTDPRWAAFVGSAGALHIPVAQSPDGGHPWRRWDDPSHVLACVQADLELLARVRPDVVLHDVRWSMIVACEIAGVPCATVFQYSMYPGFAFPGRDAAEFWGDKRASFNVVLAHYGLPKLHTDLRELFMRHPVLVPSTPEFEQIPADADQDIRYVGPLLFRPNGPQTQLAPAA